MYKTCLIFISLVFSYGLLSQGEYDKCYFGTAAVDFGGLFPVVLNNSGMETLESAASVSDDQGNLLFYSNGGNSPTYSSITGAVWNASHEIMENGILGDSSGCISSFHGAIAIPSPATNGQNKAGSNSYYLFLRDCAESTFSEPNYNSGLTYCIIDMNANGGLGKVVEKNQSVVPFGEGVTSVKTNHEPVTAVRNENNIDWWIFSYNNDSIYNVALTENGIDNYQSHDISDGAIVVSPRRDKLIAGEKLYDFDASNGQLNYLMTLEVWSASFSSDGSKLYSFYEGDIFQYDLGALDILNSKTKIASVSNINRLYLAPDSRIYLFKKNANNLPGYIECPNNNALEVGVTMNAFSLNGKESAGDFTNIPACYLYQETVRCTASAKEMNSIGKSCFIYPNPADNAFSVFNNTNKRLNKVKILDASGRMSMTVSRNFKAPINVSELSNGVYFVYLFFSDEVVVNKLFIN